jgi:hypothetical protein
MSSPQTLGALLNATSGTIATAPHNGGIAAITSALAGTLTVSTSAGAVTTLPPGSVGVFAIPSSGGAQLTSWLLSNAADVGKVNLALQIPNAYVL